MRYQEWERVGRGVFGTQRATTVSVWESSCKISGPLYKECIRPAPAGRGKITHKSMSTHLFHPSPLVAFNTWWGLNTDTPQQLDHLPDSVHPRPPACFNHVRYSLLLWSAYSGSPCWSMIEVCERTNLLTTAHTSGMSPNRRYDSCIKRPHQSAGTSISPILCRCSVTNTPPVAWSWWTGSLSTW